MDPTPPLPAPPPLPPIPAAPPIARDPLHQPHAAPGVPAFSREFPCIHCAYDLRSITLSDRCPECGKPAADSLDSLAATNAEDLATVRRGLSYLVVAGVLFPLLALAVILTMVFGGGVGRNIEVFVFLAGFLVLVCGPICGAIGAGFTTTPIRRAQLPAACAGFVGPPTRPMPARLLLGLHCLLSIFLGLLIMAISNTRGGSEENRIFAAAMLAGLVLLAWDARNFMLCRAIGGLCARTNLSGTRRVFQILAVITICFAVAHALAMLLGMVAFFNTRLLDRLFSGSPQSPMLTAAYIIFSIISSIIQFATLGWMILWPIMLLITRHRLARPLALATAARGDFLSMPENPDAAFITIERNTGSNASVPSATVSGTTSPPGASSSNP